MTEFEEKNNDAERIIIDLKNQLQEAKKVENNIEQQLKKREKELEKFEAELILLERRQMKNPFNQSLRVVQKLDDILSCQI